MTLVRSARYARGYSRVNLNDDGNIPFFSIFNYFSTSTNRWYL